MDKKAGKKSENVSKPHYYGKMNGVHIYHATDESHKKLIGVHLENPSDDEVNNTIKDCVTSKKPIIVIHGCPPESYRTKLSPYLGPVKPGTMQKSEVEAELIKGTFDQELVLKNHKDYRSALKHADSKHFPEEFLYKGEPNHKIREVADSYAASKGLKLNHDLPNHTINPEHSAKIAQAFSEMKHDPNHPDVKRSYDALIHETTEQFKHIRNNGLKISRITPGMDNPYKNGSKDLVHDVTHNNHMWYYPTESGFGSNDAHSDHPLLKPTEEKHDGHTLLANDVFRIVHDYFGHVKEGHSFGPRGEDNAWKHHMQMYSPEAKKALTSETRGQNSWVNYGPHGEHNRANPAKTIYADQKAGLMPEWAMEHHESEPIKKSDNLEIIGDLQNQLENFRYRLEKALGPVDEESLISVPGSEIQSDPETCPECDSTQTFCSCYAGLSKPVVEFDLKSKKLTVLFKSEWDEDSKESFVKDLKSRAITLIRKKYREVK